MSIHEREKDHSKSVLRFPPTRRAFGGRNGLKVDVFGRALYGPRPGDLSRDVRARWRFYSFLILDRGGERAQIRILLSYTPPLPSLFKKKGETSIQVMC